MLNSTQLAAKCKKTIPDFVGVFSRDTLPHEWQAGSYIINLQGINQGDKQGTHWTAFHLTHTELDYFDPYGSFPPTDVLNFARKSHPNIQFRFSPWVFQSLKSSRCGMICYAWLWAGSTTGDYLNAGKNTFKSSESQNDEIAQDIWSRT